MSHEGESCPHCEGTGQQLPPKLTTREAEVLELLVEGMTNRVIGANLNLTERTVKSYVASLMRKKRVKNRHELASKILSNIMASTLDYTVLREKLRCFNDKLFIICTGILEGKRNAEIAADVGTTEQVVKNYCRIIYNTSGMDNRLELLTWLFAVYRGDANPPSDERVVEATSRMHAGDTTSSNSSPVPLNAQDGRIPYKFRAGQHSSNSALHNATRVEAFMTRYHRADPRA